MITSGKQYDLTEKIIDLKNPKLIGPADIFKCRSSQERRNSFDGASHHVANVFPLNKYYNIGITIIAVTLSFILKGEAKKR